MSLSRKEKPLSFNYQLPKEISSTSIKHFQEEMNSKINIDLGNNPFSQSLVKRDGTKISFLSNEQNKDDLSQIDFTYTSQNNQNGGQANEELAVNMLQALRNKQFNESISSLEDSLVFKSDVDHNKDILINDRFLIQDQNNHYDQKSFQKVQTQTKQQQMGNLEYVEQDYLYGQKGNIVLNQSNNAIMYNKQKLCNSKTVKEEAKFQNNQLIMLPLNKLSNNQVSNQRKNMEEKRQQLKEINDSQVFIEDNTELQEGEEIKEDFQENAIINKYHLSSGSKMIPAYYNKHQQNLFFEDNKPQAFSHQPKQEVNSHKKQNNSNLTHSTREMKEQSELQFQRIQTVNSVVSTHQQQSQITNTLYECGSIKFTQKSLITSDADNYSESNSLFQIQKYNPTNVDNSLDTTEMTNAQDQLDSDLYRKTVNQSSVIKQASPIPEGKYQQLKQDNKFISEVKQIITNDQSLTPRNERILTSKADHLIEKKTKQNEQLESQLQILSSQLNNQKNEQQQYQRGNNKSCSLISQGNQTNKSNSSVNLKSPNQQHSRQQTDQFNELIKKIQMRGNSIDQNNKYTDKASSSKHSNNSNNNNHSKFFSKKTENNYQKANNYMFTSKRLSLNDQIINNSDVSRINSQRDSTGNIEHVSQQKILSPQRKIPISKLNINDLQRNNEAKPQNKCTRTNSVLSSFPQGRSMKKREDKNQKNDELTTVVDATSILSPTLKSQQQQTSQFSLMIEGEGSMTSIIKRKENKQNMLQNKENAIPKIKSTLSNNLSQNLKKNTTILNNDEQSANVGYSNNLQRTKTLKQILKDSTISHQQQTFFRSQSKAF